MRRLVLKAILYLGRYAILPAVALACVLFFVWLKAIDSSPVTALATAPIVLFVTPAIIALALGLVLLPSRRDSSRDVDEEKASGLWSIWKELDPAFVRSRRTLLIDENFNASISEDRRYAGLFNRHVTMTVGLPLLMILDERAVRAIVAHEVAHAHLQHTTGSANLRDFLLASENVLHYADPDRTITGRIAHVLLHSLREWIEKEYRALSRENELSADGGAASQVGRDEAARSLVLVEGADARLADLIFAPLEKEMIGAITAPLPPFQRMSRRLHEILEPQALVTAAVSKMDQAQGVDPTHPPLRTRLINLGFTKVPQIDGIKTPAIDHLLSREAAIELQTRFDSDWCKHAEEWGGLGR